MRLDIDETVSPDVVGTMTDMSEVEAETMDAVFSSHNIEHLYPHEVGLALSEFKRVLNPDGFLVMTCPDLQSVAELIAQDKLLEPAYNSPAGPISPLDILFGHRPSLASGNLYMAHHCGFTQSAMVATLKSAGFQSIASAKRGQPQFDLWVLATKSTASNQVVRELAGKHFPG